MQKVQIKFPKIELEIGAQDMEKELEFISFVEKVLETPEFEARLAELVECAMAKVQDLIKLSYNRTEHQSTGE